MKCNLLKRGDSNVASGEHGLDNGKGCRAGELEKKKTKKNSRIRKNTPLKIEVKGIAGEVEKSEAGI